MRWHPTHDRLIVKRLAAEETKGTIIIPGVAQERPYEGEVTATGEGRYLEDGRLVKPCAAVGDHVIYGKYSGAEMMIDAEEYVILRDDEVLLVRRKGA